MLGEYYGRYSNMDNNEKDDINGRRWGKTVPMIEVAELINTFLRFLVLLPWYQITLQF